VPAEQNQNSPGENPTVLDQHNPSCLTIPTDCNGPNHGPPNLKWKRCHPDHSGPRMLESGSIPTMLHQYYRTRDSPTLPDPHLSLVRTPTKSNQQQRPLIHVTLWQSASNQTWTLPKPVHSIPPTNRWSERTNGLSNT
jgi:hypothetical protein